VLTHGQFLYLGNLIAKELKSKIDSRVDSSIPILFLKHMRYDTNKSYEV
jgi:hypothetical protein